MSQLRLQLSALALLALVASTNSWGTTPPPTFLANDPALSATLLSEPAPLEVSKLSGSADVGVSRASTEFERAQQAASSTLSAFGSDRDSRGTLATHGVLSAPYGAYATRLFLEQQSAVGILGDGTVAQSQVAVGINQPFGATGLALQGSAVRKGNAGDVGVRVAGSSVFGPGYKVTVNASTQDAVLPAKAAENGVSARSSSLEIQSRSVRDVTPVFRFAQQSFSDGNRRRSAAMSVSSTGDGEGSLRSDWTFRAGYEASTRSDVSYFSPSTAWTSEVERGTRLTPKLHAHSWLASVRPFVTLGSISQPGYGIRAAAGAGFAGTWAMSKGVSMSLDVRGTHRAFDGVYSSQVAGQLSFVIKLP